MVVEDLINELGNAVCQHTPIGGRVYVVREDAVKDLDNWLTLLVQ